jgi:surfactin family lipopeptide synthetase A
MMITTTETLTKNSLVFEDLFAQKIYWLNQLAGDLPESNFLTDYVRPALFTGRNQRVEFELSEKVSTPLLKLANYSNFSIYLILLTAFKVLLHKYTGNHETIIGVPVYYPQERTGSLTNIVPIRSTLIEQLTFQEFLLQVKEKTIHAYAHSDYSFTEIIQLLNLSTTQNRCPIFDSVVLLENIHDSDACANLTHDLTVSFQVNETQILGKIEYNESLFNEATIQYIAQHYLTLLEQVITHPTLKISEINLLTESEKDLVLNTFNNNSKIYPVEQTLHHLFEQQVEKTPEQVAVVSEEIELTYQQLNERANQLAHLLQNLGVKSGEFVGIFQQRNPEFLTAILAILKVGAVYVPMDSSYPPARIQYMLSQSEVRVVITNSALVNVLSECLPCCPVLNNIICTDSQANQTIEIESKKINLYDCQDIEKFSVKNLEVTLTGNAPAYMIYTSGSTGLPKGAIIQHQGAINHIYAQFDALQLNQSLTFLQSAPASSDISVWQFLAPLLIGGKTVIAKTETICDSETLFKLIQEQGLTLVELVPIVLRGLIDYASRLSLEIRDLPALKWMMVTGESASVELVNQWLKIYPNIPVVNAYGPTEAADDITQFIAGNPLPKNLRTVPIGKPLANLNLYILDSQNQCLPIGIPGEICVSGIGVGLGYWKNEEKTQSSFISDPHYPLPITHYPMYKTGDLGRWLPDGNIEFLGRIDRQVKIRGFRIELGEIEALLNQHPSVEESVVIVRDDIGEDARLVAYIVTKRSRSIEEIEESSFESSLVTRHSSLVTSKLRDFLKEKLPEPSIPSAFVEIGTIPLTPSGKIDRRSLPAPDLTTPATQKTFVAPRNAVEEVLTGIWRQVLKLETVGVQDNFFEIGGHSLLATQLISRIREAFQTSLPVRQLFESPTVAQLAAYLIATEAKPGRTEKIAQVWKKLQQMSAEEAKQALQRKKVEVKA